MMRARARARVEARAKAGQGKGVRGPFFLFAYYSNFWDKNGMVVPLLEDDIKRVGITTSNITINMKRK